MCRWPLDYCPHVALPERVDCAERHAAVSVHTHQQISSYRSGGPLLLGPNDNTGIRSEPGAGKHVGLRRGGQEGPGWGQKWIRASVQEANRTRLSLTQRGDNNGRRSRFDVWKLTGTDWGYRSCRCAHTEAWVSYGFTKTNSPPKHFLHSNREAEVDII